MKKTNSAFTFLKTAYFLAFVLLLTGCGVIGGSDSLKGYYAIQVNPAPSAPPDKQGGNMVFGFERLVLNENHTFRLGFLRGDWKHFGGTVTLTPTAIPPQSQFYAHTTMADTLSVMLKPTNLSVSSDNKTLTVTNAPNGPVVFTKTSDGLQ